MPKGSRAAAYRYHAAEDFSPDHCDRDRADASRRVTKQRRSHAEFAMQFPLPRVADNSGNLPPPVELAMGACQCDAAGQVDSSKKPLGYSWWDSSSRALRSAPGSGFLNTPI